MIERPESLLLQIRDGKVDKEKVDNCFMYINHLESQVEYAKHLHEKTKVKLEREKRRLEKYKKYIALCLELAGGKLEGKHTKVSFGRKNYRVEVEDLSKVPDEFIVEKTLVLVDKNKAKKLLKDGEIIEGLDYRESSKTITWR